MPKKNAKAQKSNELDGAEFFAAINLIEKEKGIPKAYMLEKITQALVSAYKRDHEGAGDNVTVEADEDNYIIQLYPLHSWYRRIIVLSRIVRYDDCGW